MSVTTKTILVNKTWTLITNVYAVIQFNDKMTMAITSHGEPTEDIGLIMEAGQIYTNDAPGTAVWVKGYSSGSNIESVRVIENAIKTQQTIFPFGELFVAKKHDDVSVQFQYDYLDTTYDVHTGVVGNGIAGVDTSVAYCDSVDASGMAYIESKDSVRYRPGHSGFIDMTLGVDTSNGGYGHGGGFDHTMQNGFIIHIEDSKLYFGFLKDGVKTGSNFNIGLDLIENHGLVLSNLNIYRIVFGYLGIANPVLSVKISGGWKFLHMLDTEGKGTSTHTSTPVFPMCVMAHGGAKAYTASWNGGVMGDESSVGNRGFHFPTQLITSGTAAKQGEILVNTTDTVTAVLFRAKDTFKTKPNNIKARLSGYTFTVDIPAGNYYGDVVFQLVRVTSISGTPTYVDINSNSSIIQYDHTNGVGASVSVTAGVPIAQETVSYTGASKGGTAGKVTINAEQLGAFAYRWSMFAILIRNLGGTSVKARVTLNWEELF